MKAGRKTKLEKRKKTKHLKKYFFWALTASNDSGFVLKQKMGMQFKDPNTDSKGRQILTQNTLLTEVVDEVHKAKEKNKAGYLNKKQGNHGL